MQFLQRALLFFSAILPGFAFDRATSMQAQEAATLASAAVSLPDAPSQQEAKPAATQSPSQQDRFFGNFEAEFGSSFAGLYPVCRRSGSQLARKRISRY
jgi:hypothetical protein